MLTGHSIIYFGPGKWDGMWRNRHHLMSILARQNKVLFVEARRSLRQTVVDRQNGNLPLAEVKRPTLRHIADNLFVFRYPVWAPATERFPLGPLTTTVRRLALKNALRRLHMADPIVWFHRPTMMELIPEIPPARLRLYHVVDEYTGYQGHTPESRRHLREVEAQMIALVDGVIVVSKKLYEAKRPFKAHTYLVPNGVNYQAYTAALAQAELLGEYQKIERPRLGYSGLIGDRLNLSMLADLARKNPHWSLVFLGEVRLTKQAQTWQALQALPNVHYLGLVDISQVPHYLKGFDVGLMPYMQDWEAEHISPIKLYDYLAAGLPIASIDIPAVREFKAYVHVADRPEVFGQAVQAALGDTTPARYQARRRVAAQHSWEARAEQLSEVIEGLLVAKTSVSSNAEIPADLSPLSQAGSLG